MNKSQQIYIALGLLFLLVGVGGGIMFSKDDMAVNTSNDAYNSQQKAAEATPTPIVDNPAYVQPSPVVTISPSVDNNSNKGENNAMTTDEKLKVQKPQTMIDKTHSFTATIKTTDGNMIVKLYADKVPVTANNFVYLARMGFYNDVIFHRVIKGFMIQSGDPMGTGGGGPAYEFDDEEFDGEYKKGTLAMANAGRNTNGSQFFIVQGDNVGLAKSYVIFGEVTEGLDVVDKIANQEVEKSGGGSKPINPTKILSVDIQEN